MYIFPDVSMCFTGKCDWEFFVSISPTFPKQCDTVTRKPSQSEKEPSPRGETPCLHQHSLLFVFKGQEYTRRD